MFELSKLAQVTLQYIERCFTMVAETHNLLMLYFGLIKNILISPELHLTSELQVFDAVDYRISNIEQRSKFARDLLFQVRLHLQSDKALTVLLNKTSSICDN